MANDPAKALKNWHHDVPDLVLSDMRMGRMDGIAFYKALRELNADVPVVVMTAFGTVETAKQALKPGVYDYLLKPLDVDELLQAFGKALEAVRLRNENVSLKSQLKRQYQYDRAVGNSPAWRQVMDSAETVAASDATVLLLGESGTGKELVASAIHEASPRAKGKLIKVHCAALPENLMEAELFGHERGAFTGATHQRKGRVEEADGGTLFLDEVGEILPAMQVKLLRVLQEKTFQRLGSSVTLKSNFRLIAATNRDLDAEVKAGHFREDLYYRLNVIRLRLPPLRERPEDVPLLAQHFLDKFNSLNNKRVHGFAPAVLAALETYAYPGNVRELENIVERAVVFSRGKKIETHELPEHLRQPAVAPASGSVDGLEKLWRGEVNLDALEKNILEEAMRRAQGIQTSAATILGISRQTLQYRLEKYGLIK